MIGRFFDWLSNLRPRQLFMLAGGSAIIIFCIMYIGLKHFSVDRSLPINIGENGEIVETPPPVQMVSVVVANRNIEPKAIILGSMLATKEIPENQVPADAVLDIADIANKPARVRILKDEIITHPQVYRNIEQSGFVGSIPPDCRAVSIQLNDVTGVAGFAKPGDYVDVLMIEHDDDTVTSRLILQNVLLLSINKSMTDEVQPQPQPQQGAEGEEQEVAVNPATRAIENPALATLALRPDEVLQLVSATKIGEIYLMLRPLVPQGDYYNGAEYSMESMRAKKEAAAKTEQENVRQASLWETLVEKKGDTVREGGGVSAENRIAIMYGDEEGIKDKNSEIKSSVSPGTSTTTTEDVTVDSRGNRTTTSSRTTTERN